MLPQSTPNILQFIEPPFPVPNEHQSVAPDSSKDTPANTEEGSPGRLPRYWRSAEELRGSHAPAGSPENEFSPSASVWPANLDRRKFLQLMAASFGLAGLTSCTRQPSERIVPYVRQPEELVPGNPLTFATAMTLGGYATGLLVESHEGHPTKIEGNPGHTMSLGASNIFQQASLLDLYDPDRSRAIVHDGETSSWSSFLSELHAALEAEQSSKGAGIRILTETVTSPTLHSQIRALLTQYPNARWHQYEPINQGNVHEGARLAFGEVLAPQYRFEDAAIILSLDADFLFAHPASLRYTREFARRRGRTESAERMNRLYVVEPNPSVTGSNADHRLAIAFSDVLPLCRALASQLGATSGDEQQPVAATHQKWLAAVADDLLKNRGRGIVLAGGSQPPEVHALAHVMNHFLGNAGKTVRYTLSAEHDPVNQVESLRALSEDLELKKVRLLVMIGGNPCHAAPADFSFSQRLAKASMRVHLSPDLNETSMACQWHIPQNHYLESWGDARGYDGALSIIQPLILPLYAGKSSHELLDACLRQETRSDYDIVRDHWREESLWGDFESGWRQALHDGIVPGTNSPERNATPRALKLPPVSSRSSRIEVVFHPDPCIWDGRFANNGWLQELAKPVTKLVWDNAAMISPQLARELNLSNGDLVEIRTGSRSLRLPAWITPGQATHSVSVSLGYGRTKAGEVGRDRGFNSYPLRDSSSQWATQEASLAKVGGSYPLAATQRHHSIDSEERQVYRETTMAEFLENKEVIKQLNRLPDRNTETLFNTAEHDYNGYHWGMSINLGACIGCNACVLACQSENNIPVVGKQQVAAGREMQWIRIDTYFSGEPDAPAMNHQPVPCMQCENAPCELVCPVGATLHDHEGLNLQVYNRCIGTRYCSNNCPYKVRRFNFLQYADYHTPSLKPMRNPNVTVRSRGVMEKCTYCIQRISAARIASEREDRPIRDGEIQTACQQACPAEAIVFGDQNNPASKVAMLKRQPLDYSMLGELNTRPRTTYLAKVRNPNPVLVAKSFRPKEKSGG